MTDTIAIVGSPTALGGHFAGMDRGPAALRQAGFIDRLRSRAGLAGVTVIDHGDAPIEAGWAPDPDPVMKNRQLIIDYLGRLIPHVEAALGTRATSLPDVRASSAVRFPSAVRDASGVITGGSADDPPPTTPSLDAPTGITGGMDESATSSDVDAEFASHPNPRLLILGGDCTSHSGTMAALKRHRPEARLAIAWLDAHGDFNIPETTPSGNVWGMPFAMLCGRGDPGLVAACDGPTVREEDAALIGAQVLDEQEVRMLAASPVALFGSGMLKDPAGQAALEAWARVVGERCDGLYIAFDLDAIDQSEGIAVAMPEPDGLSVDTAVAALRILARHNRIVGFGPTATMRRHDVSDAAFDRHVEIVARLAEAALGRQV